MDNASYEEWRMKLAMKLQLTSVQLGLYQVHVREMGKIKNINVNKRDVLKWTQPTEDVLFDSLLHQQCLGNSVDKVFIQWCMGIRREFETIRVKDVADATREGNAIAETGRPRVLSEQEVFEELVNIGVDTLSLFQMQGRSEPGLVAQQRSARNLYRR
ncbi:hypothetical protein PTKIN_Ptkin09bG0093700 [Pterospermum kingtungense]